MTSPGGAYALDMQPDGNLVEYHGSSVLFSSGTAGDNGASVTMQGDGNLVIYLNGAAKWSSNTAGFSGAYLQLQDDGNMVVYQGAHPLWDPATGYMGDTLNSGATLTANQYLWSPNHSYFAVMQGDGNFVLYHGSSVLWQAGTAGNSGASVTMQGDGNLVVYLNGVAKWNAGTAGHSGSRLILQNDDNMVIYQGSTAIWDWESGPLSSGGGTLTAGQWPGTSGPGAAHQYYGYPYSNPPACTDGGACVLDAWKFYEGQCTSWVAYRLNQLNGIGFTDYYKGPQRGDAGHWAATAQSLGIPVNATPARGSVAWYGTSGDHVAYVEQVNSSTSIVISEMNYDFDNGFRVRTVTAGTSGWPADFIHIADR